MDLQVEMSFKIHVIDLHGSFNFQVIKMVMNLELEKGLQIYMVNLHGIILLPMHK
jgi:hypothetical protein